MTDLLIVGCGYLGKRVAAIVRQSAPDARVQGTTRSTTKAEKLAQLGITPVVADVRDPSSLSTIPLPPSILHCVGFDRSAGHSMRSVYVDGLRAFLSVLEASGWCGRFVYVSSTGVYGQDDGSWVDEDSVTEPSHESGIV